MEDLEETWRKVLEVVKRFGAVAFPTTQVAEIPRHLRSNYYSLRKPCKKCHRHPNKCECRLDAYTGVVNSKGQTHMFAVDRSKQEFQREIDEMFGPYLDKKHPDYKYKK